MALLAFLLVSSAHHSPVVTRWVTEVDSDGLVPCDEGSYRQVLYGYCLDSASADSIAAVSSMVLLPPS
ncbi:hypothetical protein FHX42_001449 [Saccharopolyspora lacisalsi]|uniref:Uncharacterized protein n=1 Tax=Halosaccharopolyspora lacisalsi TaxID=1000566 RepID=A0A839DT48_9PSEU|nr:hypothetical protein [Halosaccharopolyspora lacisalsi]